MPTNPDLPKWSTKHLEQALAEAAEGVVELTPRGDVATVPAPARPRDGGPTTLPGRADGSIPLAVVVPHAAPSVLVDQWRQLPAALALCAIDPEGWCAVQIDARAINQVGPFRDGVSPLRDWLLRAAAGGHVEIGEIPHEKSPSERYALPMPALVPTGDPRRCDWLWEFVDAFARSARPGRDSTARTDAVALSAGIWQMNDCVELSHELSQRIEGAGRHRAGDYWHAINHRREPDDSNAKYWLRRVGRHPIHDRLARGAATIRKRTTASELQSGHGRSAQEEWEPFGFVDLCKSAREGADPALDWAVRAIQLLEMLLLLESTYLDAVGG